ncbi:ubiquitin-conjugating enzyme E2 J1-like [Mya arenaria]|uniref:ubiquitin-conjugating enzyme E2 J1-like n=1 Tax=Mya arenaria TaxID=6604 RepID=UPI0022E30BFC|nr:ubiquitin-conjugating enzyme E2 J1-like [Mya arenaria]
MQGMYSMRSPAVKRLMKEAQELSEPTEQYACHPLEDNLFEWHFTIRGPADSEFDGGLYHGRIVLPPDYPMKPPSIIILTPNGRFEINQKICLSISGHHPESWQPSWSLRTAVLAIIGFMPTHGAGALGSLDYTPDERKILAKKSQDFKCPSCGNINNILKPVTEESKKTTEEAKELAAQIDFKDEKEKNAALKQSQGNSTPSTEEASSNEATGVEGAQASPQPQFSPPLLPPQMGQFPFGIPLPHGFLPPHPQATGNPANPATQVPRFPLPYMSPFFPPMPPPILHPVFPGMRLHPWQQGTPAPAFSPPSGEQRSDNNATSTNDNTQNPEGVQDTNSESEGPSSPSPAQPEIQTIDNTSQEGLRQRTVTQSVQNTSSLPGRSAELGTRHVPQTYTSSRSGDVALLTFGLFVISVIILLLIRRMHMMNLFSMLN